MPMNSARVRQDLQDGSGQFSDRAESPAPELRPAHAYKHDLNTYLAEVYGQEIRDTADILRSISETKAKYVRLGKSGLYVSVPILVFEEEEALPILEAAYDRGVNTWNTANVYSNGVSEEIIGKIPREKLVILTKCFNWVGDSPGSKSWIYRHKYGESKDFANQGGLSRKAIFSAVGSSLKRMDIEYIDLLQIRRFDPNVPIEETLEALHDLVKAGKVRYIGASSMWEEREMNKFCKETGVGLIPWAPLCRWHLARPPSPTELSPRSLQEKKMRLVLYPGHSESDRVIIGRGWTMSVVALAWINKRVLSPIVGCNSIERIDDTLAARGKELTEEDEKYLAEPYVTRDIQGHY
ncbi:hypothetical protein OIDMADRAFT_44457 [Oidiodendron maius Zn]|uniref:NADP-dependent oxidoreductase domain-containing protein n=1 Tax=Oidiodendron maius (strain Zn) TaxID=913774 RepID=A0A0C3CDJ5_OIDMZ|nr:hypothetical protein OIDMADRAFT_44457 [Oidiodendron maius Zn]